MNTDYTMFLKYYTQGRDLTTEKCELQNSVLESVQSLDLIRLLSSIKSTSYTKVSSAHPVYPQEVCI